MAEKPILATAIITYNEEEKIRACLDSVVDFVDEIVVLDSYSTDATKEICTGYSKVKFYQHSFDGHVQQKNRAIELCTAPWILSIDADERVTPELRQSIVNFLDGNPDVSGAKFPRLTFHLHRYIRHSGWYPNARYRLFRKGQARWGGENPHDRIILHGKGVTLKGDLLHYSVIDLSDQVKTINSFTSIAALTRYNKGKNFSLFRLLFKPPGAFVETYLLKLGVLDGMQGFIIAVCAAYYVFLREAKLFELSVLNSDKPSNLSESYSKER